MVVMDSPCWVKKQWGEEAMFEELQLRLICLYMCVSDY